MAGGKNILQVFASPGWGGGERYVYDLSEELIKNGHNVTLLARECPVIAAKVKGLDADFFTLPLKGVTDIRSARKMADIIRKHDINVVHVHNFKDAFTAIYAKSMLKDKDVRVVMTRHMVKRGRNTLHYRYLYKHIDKIIFVSELAENEFLSGAKSISGDKVTVVHNSIYGSDNVIAGDDVRIRFLNGDHDLLLGFAGRVAPEKGLDVLINALGILSRKDIALLVIGMGEESYVNELKQQAVKCGVGDKVFFYGYTENVYPLQMQVDVGVVPSVIREAGSLSVLEYMRAGKPVISTNNGSQKEYVTHGVNGFLVPPSDAGALAEAIKCLADDSSLRKEMSEKSAEAFREKFEYGKFYARIISMYENNRNK